MEGNVCKVACEATTGIANSSRAKEALTPQVSVASHLNSLFFPLLLLFHLCTFSAFLLAAPNLEEKDTNKECGVRNRRSSLHPFPPNVPALPLKTCGHKLRTKITFHWNEDFLKDEGGTKIISQTESTLDFSEESHHRDSRPEAEIQMPHLPTFI